MFAQSAGKTLGMIWISRSVPFMATPLDLWPWDLPTLAAAMRPPTQDPTFIDEDLALFTLLFMPPCIMPLVVVVVVVVVVSVSLTSSTVSLARPAPLVVFACDPRSCCSFRVCSLLGNNNNNNNNNNNKGILHERSKSQFRSFFD